MSAEGRGALDRGADYDRRTDVLVAYCLTDAHGTVIASRNADRPTYAASTIKLGVLSAALGAMDAGDMALDEVLTSTHAFASGIDGGADFRLHPDDVDLEFPAPGEPVAIAAVLDAMITRSSNEATDLLVDRLGLEVIARAFREAGALRTTMGRRIGDRAAIDAGITNETCAGDLTVLVRALVSSRSPLSERSRIVARDLLARQRFPRIGLETPSGTVWGSKGGEVQGIEHDAAFVGDPDGPDVRYLAICTRGFALEQSTPVIRALAALLLRTPRV